MAKTLRTPRHERMIARLAEERRAKSMTQTDLAAALGRPQSFVAKVERGERRLDVLEFADLASALGFAPSDLLKRVLAD